MNRRTLTSTAVVAALTMVVIPSSVAAQVFRVVSPVSKLTSLPVAAPVPSAGKQSLTIPESQPSGTPRLAYGEVARLGVADAEQASYLRQLQGRRAGSAGRETSAISSRDALPVPGQFYAVADISAHDVWAVGSSIDGAITEHYNGSKWTVVPRQHPYVGMYLDGVAAVSGSDVWAVGQGDSGPLIEHYNGAKWIVVASPHVGTNFSLSGVAAISANDIWAVGGLGERSDSDTLIEHYNGVKWSVVSGANAGKGASLSGVAAISSNNVWAVGWTNQGALAEHYNGAKWTVVATPNSVTGLIVGLNGVSAVSASNVWAVGWGTASLLIEHYNGAKWTVVSSPKMGAGILDSITANAANNVWAVGGDGSGAPLAEHYNGVSWGLIPLPNAGKHPLYGVAATTADDVWVVGSLIEHYNGTKWRGVPTPNFGTGGSLNGAAAISARNVWAVGTSNGGTLVEHYNGMKWRVVDSPNAGTSTDYLKDLVAVSANDIWAVGDSASGLRGLHEHPLVEHYNGTKWSVVSSPSPGTTASLRAVAAISARNIWAVGYTATSLDAPFHALIEHFNGVRWSVVASPNGGAGDNYLLDVAAVSSANIWTVGVVGGSCPPKCGQPLIEHFNGTKWSVVSSPYVYGQHLYEFAGLGAVKAISTTNVWAVGEAGH
jgi:hypothetical protein